MNENNSTYQMQDEVFSILSHPIRRRILTEMFNNGSLSFSLLSKDWKIGTGTIYHHLKSLDPLIIQNSENLYQLNEKGMMVCEWFLQTKSGKANVQKIDAFTALVNPVLVKISLHANEILIISLLALFMGHITSSQVGAIILGPFILPIPNNINTDQVLLFNTLVTICLFLLYTGSRYVFQFSNRMSETAINTGFILSLLPTNLVVVLFYIVDQLFRIEITLPIWIILSFMTQLFFLILNSAILVAYCGSSVEKAGLHGLFLLYILLGFGAFLI
ncbi:MAG: winged helix-turn-helix domain-containing protein [Candidatus Kariarchaeaceae archaeon]|jgi:hypothetical protein